MHEVDYIRPTTENVSHDCKIQHVDMYQSSCPLTDQVPAKRTVVRNRFVVKARRNESEQWTDWSETNDESMVLKQLAMIEEAGYQSMVIDRENRT